MLGYTGWAVNLSRNSYILIFILSCNTRALQSEQLSCAFTWPGDMVHPTPLDKSTWSLLEVDPTKVTEGLLGHSPTSPLEMAISLFHCPLTSPSLAYSILFSRYSTGSSQILILPDQKPRQQGTSFVSLYRGWKVSDDMFIVPSLHLLHGWCWKTTSPSTNSFPQHPD